MGWRGFILNKPKVFIGRKIPDEVESKSDENPYYGGMMLLPIRLILDHLYPIEKSEWRK